MLEAGELTVGSSADDLPLIKPVEIYEAVSKGRRFQHSVFRGKKMEFSIYLKQTENDWIVFCAEHRDFKRMSERIYFCDGALWMGIRPSIRRDSRHKPEQVAAGNGDPCGHFQPS